MDSRQNYLLQGLVTEYIRTARPVGSQALGVRLRLDLSSATIRNILRDLEEQGFIMQPHTSAGRVPTDRGYRAYVDQVLGSPMATETTDIAQQFDQIQQEYRQVARASAKLMSRLAHTIAVSGFLTRGDVQEAGLPEVLEQPEGEDTEIVRELSAVLRDVDQYLEKLFVGQPVGTHVYIGHENPLYPSQHISLVVHTHETPTGEKIVLVLAGPKRMEYRRNVNLLNTLAMLINQHTL